MFVFILPNANTIVLVCIWYSWVALNEGICDWLSKTFHRYMNLNISIIRNKCTVKICDMRCIATLIKLDDRDAIDNWSLLKISKAISKKRESYDTSYYDTPIQIGTLPWIFLLDE